MRAFNANQVALAGLNLVEASAGTGKTHAITSLVIRLVVERGLGIERVLVVTFTEAAAAELRDRVRTRLSRALRRFSGAGSARVDALPVDAADQELDAQLRSVTDDATICARLDMALKRFDEAAISTIHGFCQRCLTESAFESGGLFESELVPDLSTLRDEVVRDYWTLETYDAPPELLERLGAHKLTLAACQNLADRVVSNPALKVLPYVPSAPNPDRAPLDRAALRAQQAFDGEALRRVLQQTGINRTKLKLERVEPLLDELSRLLDVNAGGPPSLGTELPAGSKHLGQRRLPLNKHTPTPQHAFFAAWDDVLDELEALNAAWRDKVAAFVTGLVAYARLEIPRRKRERGLVSFDDLLQQLDSALHGPRGAGLAAQITGRFPAALIDEFQDTDAVQWRIFCRLYSDALDPQTRPVNRDPEAAWRDQVEPQSSADELGPLFLIGDPKQAIYNFRGADLNVYLAAAERAAPDRRFTMLTNWRSDPALVQALGDLYAKQRIALPFLLEQVSFPRVHARPGATDQLSPAVGAPEPALQLVFVPGELERQLGIPELCSREVLRLLGAGLSIEGRDLIAGDLAVLTRTNDQAFAVQRALAERRVPSVVLGDRSVFLALEAQELGKLLQAIAEPSQSQLIKSALTTELLGLTANQLEALDQDDRGWDQWVGRFRGWNLSWTQRGFVQMLQQALAELGSFERLLSLGDGERRLTNLLHLTELLHAAARSLHLGPAGLLAWFELQIDDQTQRADDLQVRLESDERAVTITTVHKSKGLEYPVVLCPFMSGGNQLHQREHRQPIFHDPNTGELTLALDLGEPSSDACKNLAATEHLEESLRLLYVALTRARHRVVLLWGDVGTSYGTSALGYLLHPPDAGQGPRLDHAGLKAAWSKRKPSDRLGELATLVASIDGMQLREASDVEPAPLARPSHAPPTLRARQLTRTVDQLYRTASFSGLSARSDRLELDPEEGRDRDQGGDLVEPDYELLTPELPLLAFPRGARAGNFFHDLLEHLDFTADEAALAELVERKLTSHGYQRELANAAVPGLRAALRTQLFRVPSGHSKQAAPAGVQEAPLAEDPDRDLCLADLTNGCRLDELEFHFPVHLASDQRDHTGPSDDDQLGGPRVALTAAALAAVFRDTPSAALHSGYAERVALLGFTPLRGFLKGYIDLVFRSPNVDPRALQLGAVGRGAGRRFYLVDYKTNYLGDHPRDYAARGLQQAMSHGHYYLQYHLYALALHRYLGGRIPGYRYDRDFGGVLYLFLRGMVPELGNQSGVFFEKPPLARIEALSRVISGAEVSAQAVGSGATR